MHLKAVHTTGWAKAKNLPSTIRGGRRIFSLGAALDRRFQCLLALAHGECQWLIRWRNRPTDYFFWLLDNHLMLKWLLLNFLGCIVFVLHSSILTVQAGRRAPSTATHSAFNISHRLNSDSVNRHNRLWLRNRQSVPALWWVLPSSA